MMNLLEFENQQFPGTWTEETIKELQEHEPPEGTGTPLGSEPPRYECYYGKYLADSVLW